MGCKEFGHAKAEGREKAPAGTIPKVLKSIAEESGLYPESDGSIGGSEDYSF